MVTSIGYKNIIVLVVTNTATHAEKLTLILDSPLLRDMAFVDGVEVSVISSAPLLSLSAGWGVPGACSCGSELADSRTAALLPLEPSPSTISSSVVSASVKMVGRRLGGNESASDEIVGSSVGDDVFTSAKMVGSSVGTDDGDSVGSSVGSSDCDSVGL